MPTAFGARSDSDSEDGFSDSESNSSGSSSSDSEPGGRKKVSFGLQRKSQKFRDPASLKVVSDEFEDSTSKKGGGTVWSRLRDTVLGAAQHARSAKPSRSSLCASSGGDMAKQNMLSQMGASTSRGSILQQVGSDESPGLGGNEWVAKLQSTDHVRCRHKQSCQSIASIIEELMPDQVWSLNPADRIKFNGRISSEVQNAMQHIGLSAFELLENIKTELDTARKTRNELEAKMLEMQKTYLKEITTNRDRSRDASGVIQATVEAFDQNSAIEFYEPLQYLSDDMRAAVISIVDEKVKQLFRCNPDIQQFANSVEMNKFESLMLSDKVESLERMNASLREENRDWRTKMKKVEHKLAKAEWEASEAKRTYQKAERELISLRAAAAAALTMACGAEDSGHQGSVGARRSTRYEGKQIEPVPPANCNVRRSTRFAADTKRRSSFQSSRRSSDSKPEVKIEGIAERDSDQSHETQECGGCGEACGCEALFCWRCGHKLGDCPPAAPSTLKQSAARRGSRFVAAFDDDLILLDGDEEGHEPVLSTVAHNAQTNADSPSAAKGIRSFASVVASVMNKATGGSKAKRLKRLRADSVESDASPLPSPSSKLERKSVVPEATFSDEEEQLPTKATRPLAKRKAGKAKTVGQESTLKKSESITSMSSTASRFSQASCKSPVPMSGTFSPETLSGTEAFSPEPEPHPPEAFSPEPLEPQERLEALELKEAPDPQEPEVTGNNNEQRWQIQKIRMTALEHDLGKARSELVKTKSSSQAKIKDLERDLEKARSDVVKTRNQLRISMDELSECRSQLAAAESRIENMDVRSEDCGDLTECTNCRRLEGNLESIKLRLEETNGLLSKEVELTQCLRECLEQAGLALANAQIGRLEALTALEETPLPKDFAENYKSQLLSDNSLAEDLEKIKSFLGEDSALRQTEAMSTSPPKRQLLPDVAHSSSTMLEARPEKPERRTKPADSYRKESQEEARLNSEVEKLVERNKLFQDKVNIKSAQLDSVCKENQVLKLALEDMQREMNTLTSDLRSAMPSQEVAPPNLELVLERMEQVVKDGKAPAHMRLHQEAKLRDVAQTTKRSKIADVADLVDERPDPPRQVFSPESTCSVGSFASNATPGRSCFSPTNVQLEPLSSPPKSQKARKGSDEIGNSGKVTRTDKKRTTMTRPTVSLGSPGVDAAEGLMVGRSPSIKSATSPGEEPTFGKTSSVRSATTPRSGASFVGRRSETLMHGNAEKSLPRVSGPEQKGNLLLGGKGGMALLGSSAKKVLPGRLSVPSTG